MNYDAYQEVINGEDTYTEISDTLLIGRSVVIGWSDGQGTHLDILFTMQPVQFGSLQGGLRGTTDLFVSIMRMGAFGFDIKSGAGTDAGYYEGKLGRGLGSTADALAELINEVRNRL